MRDVSVPLGFALDFAAVRTWKSIGPLPCHTIDLMPYRFYLKFLFPVLTLICACAISASAWAADPEIEPTPAPQQGVPITAEPPIPTLPYLTNSIFVAGICHWILLVVALRCT